MSIIQENICNFSVSVKIITFLIALCATFKNIALYIE